MGWVGKIHNETLQDYLREVLAHLKKYVGGSVALAVVGVYGDVYKWHPPGYVFWILAVGWLTLGQYKAFKMLRQAKVSEVQELRGKVAELTREAESAREEAEGVRRKFSREMVTDEHYKQLKALFMHVRDSVAKGEEVIFSPTEVPQSAGGHVPEIGSELVLWNQLVRSLRSVEEALEDCYENELLIKGLTAPIFVRAGLDFLYHRMKKRALAGRLDEGFPVPWLEPDVSLEEQVTLATGMAIAHAQEGDEELTRDACKRRIQAFVDSMSGWYVMKLYGDPAMRKTYDDLKIKFEADLNKGINLTGYYRSDDCPQCPVPPT